MKIARLSFEQGPRFAVVDEETGHFHILAGDPMYSGFQTTGQIVPADEANLVAPMLPRSKVVGVGENYYVARLGADDAGLGDAELGDAGADDADRRGEGIDPDSDPTVFLKPNTAVVGPNVPITVPTWAKEIVHEAELAVVISRLCKDVPEERASEVIFGYTVANDVTDAYTQRTDRQWARAKGFDTSCPIGPFIETDLDLADARITLRVNGEVRQEGTTTNLVRSVPKLVAYVSSMFTLLPGDIILTGAVSPAVAAGVGDEVVCEVEGIGVLRNPVVAG